MSIPNGLPGYLTGLGHTSCTVAAVTYATAGTFTAATSIDLVTTAVFSGMDHERTKGMIDIRPTNAQFVNNVAISQDFRLTVREIMKPGAVSVLKNIANTVNYAQITFSTATGNGGGTPAVIETITGAIESDSVTYDKEANMASMTLVCAGTPQF